MASHIPDNVALTQDIQASMAWWQSLDEEARYSEWLSFQRRNKGGLYDTNWKFAASSNKIREQWEFRGRPMI
jgi:hypothetical protein